MKLNGLIISGAAFAILGVVLAGISMMVAGPTRALAGEPVPCDATATPTLQPQFNMAEGGNDLSAFQAAPTDTPVPTCTPVRIRTHTPTPEPTEGPTDTPVPVTNTPAPPPATNTPTGGGAGVVTPPDTGSGDGTSGTNMALIWLAGGVALAIAGSGAFLVGVRRKS
ncbi:MAG: hypothetical protein HY873_10815 [Chloroflexi bacterium]|nr:hypothetical protein [Chloroflexota bacterium]